MPNNVPAVAGRDCGIAWLTWTNKDVSKLADANPNHTDLHSQPRRSAL